MSDSVKSLTLVSGLTPVSLMIFFVVRCDSVGGISGIIDYAGSGGLPKLSAGEWVTLSATVLMTSFGTWGLPQMVQKYFGIRDDAEEKIISTFFALLVAGGGYFIGSLAHMFYSELPEGGVDYLVPNMLARASLPSVLLGVILVLLISASVSTLSSISLTASSVLSMDIIKNKLFRNMKDRKLTVVIKVLCLMFVACSYLVANTDTPILDMMSYSWGIISGSFMAPYVLALYSSKISRAGAWSAVLTGFAIAVIPAGSKALLLAGATGSALTYLAGKGAVFACAAMISSFIVCRVVSVFTKDGHSTDLFYGKESVINA